LDDDYPIDLAIAAENELIIVHGRDRKLSYESPVGSEVEPPRVDHHLQPFRIQSLAIGNFVSNSRNDLALLSTDGDIYVLVRNIRDRAARAMVKHEQNNAVLELQRWDLRTIRHTGIISGNETAGKTPATQVDVVAHSMGGMMTRGFSQRKAEYLRKENFFQGDVDKLGTLPTLGQTW
jgi:hypothetical protein